jgi:hypothetical protein
MTSLRRFVTLSFFLTLSGYGVAQAQGVTAGDYKLAVGHATPCAVSLAADGTAAVPADCAHVTAVTHWRSTATGVEFEDNSGTILAVLKAKGDGYQGVTFADSDQLTLTH